MATRVEVYGRYVAGLRYARGTVTFTPSSAWYDTESGVVLTGAPIVVRLVRGEFHVDLWATDDADVSPPDRWYTVVEEFTTGWVGRTFDFLLPATPGPVDLVDYLPVDVGGEPGFVRLALANLDDVNLAAVPRIDGIYQLGGGGAGGGPGGYSHNQDVPGTVWDIDHGLGFDPAAFRVVAVNGDVWWPVDVTYPTPGQVARLTFPDSIAGTAVVS